MKTLVFKRNMMQRYRSILHFIDPLIDAGYDLNVEVQSKSFDKKAIHEAPMDASKASKDSCKYLCKNFGIYPNNFDKINFTTKKNVIDGLFLTTDGKKYNKPHILLPYNGFVCSDKRGDHKVGNPMCNLFDKYRKIVKEEEGTLLIIHPGGGRGYVSPVRNHIPGYQVTANNYAMLKNILKNIPNSIRKVYIKTHPVSYIGCDMKHMCNSVLPLLQQKFKGRFDSISIVKNDLMHHLVASEFILNIGSSTAIWLLGSDKKWINLLGMSQFEYKKHRECRERTENWFFWPQHVKIKGLSNLINNYNEIVNNNDKTQKVREEYRLYHQMNAIDNCMEIIKKWA